MIPQIKAAKLEPLPLPRLEAQSPQTSKLAELAKEMYRLHQRQFAAKTPQEKTALERQIAATDSQIDTLTYALYGLTEAEIKIVEQTV